jgi:iron(II)-dependent oxidoreductase
MEAAPPAVDAHIQGIARFAKPSPMVFIPAGWFLMGTNREDHERHNFESHYDNTEFPQRRIWLDPYQIDQYEVSLGEFLQFLQRSDRNVSPELRKGATEMSPQNCADSFGT